MLSLTMLSEYNESVKSQTNSKSTTAMAKQRGQNVKKKNPTRLKNKKLGTMIGSALR